MAIETERKFLVADTNVLSGYVPERIVQAYVCRGSDHMTVRIRTVQIATCPPTAFVTLKGPKADGISGHEFEYEIPISDAQEMLNLYCSGMLVKDRYKIDYLGHTFEVDVFLGSLAGLIIAEVELPSADTPVALPPWLGAEVTGDPRYFNSNMVVDNNT